MCGTGRVWRRDGRSGGSQLLSDSFRLRLKSEQQGQNMRLRRSHERTFCTTPTTTQRTPVRNLGQLHKSFCRIGLQTACFETALVEQADAQCVVAMACRWRPAYRGACFFGGTCEVALPRSTSCEEEEWETTRRKRSCVGECIDTVFIVARIWGLFLWLLCLAPPHQHIFKTFKTLRLYFF